MQCGPRWRKKDGLPYASKTPARLPVFCRAALVAELADAHGSGPCVRKHLEVRVLSRALVRNGDVPSTQQAPVLRGLSVS